MSASSDEISTYHLIYHGRVQRVGFRVTAQQIARDYDITGYVRNLSDGSVELVAQGSLAEVRKFLDALATRMVHNITDIEEVSQPQHETLQGFMIR